MSERVSLKIEDHIAYVALNRADKMNALDHAMFDAIIDVGTRLATDKSVRAVVVHGEGKAFCAGLDLSMFSSGAGVTSKVLGSREIGKAPNYYQAVCWVWKQIPVPVIAAIHGVCFGGGLQIALGADMRYAHPQTKFSVMESKWGLVPDMGGTQTLRDLVRLDVAKELTFTGRVVEAKEAAEIGLVTALADEPLQKARQIAQQIAGKNPDASVYAKQLFEQSWHGESDAGLLLEETLQAQLIGSHNQLEAVMAQMQKREPEFKERADDFYKGPLFTKGSDIEV